MTEIWIMADSLEQYNKDLIEGLKILDSGRLDILNYQKIFKNFVGLDIKKGFLSNSIICPEIYEDIVSLLCGYSWIKEVPWEN